MKYSQRSLMPWIVGPTVLASALMLMAYGLWMGEWYGYLFAAVFVVWGIFVLFVMHRARRFGKAQIRRLAREWKTADEGEGRTH